MPEHHAPSRHAQALARRLHAFVAPLLVTLDAVLDRRLVNTLFLTLFALVKLRHTKYGLLLSELGAALLSPEHAPAGTKRLSNLLRSPRWSHTAIEDFLWQQAHAQLASLRAAGETALLLWDSSVLEKPESLALEGLGSVRSSRAARLARVKPGFYTPPGPPVFVPGMQWVSVLVAGMTGAPQVACMRWWTKRGPLASRQETVERSLLFRCTARLGQALVHVFDQGFAGSPWLGMLQEVEARFVLRWKKQYALVDATGRRPAWQITRGKRSQDTRLIRDTRRRQERKMGLVVVAVTHPDYPDVPLWLVASRPGKGRKPWYLLTNEPVRTPEEGWRVVFIYARRWQAEMAYRYGKTELAMESPRLWRWENRLKLLLLVTVVYAFLLTLVREEGLVAGILKWYCPRTGAASRRVEMPLYRLRAALSYLWTCYLPPSPLLRRNSG